MRKANIFIAILALIVLQCSAKLSDRNLIFISVPSAENAKCLDGTNPGFYFAKGTSPNTLIYLIGQGNCGQETVEEMLDTCYERSFTSNGSNKGRAPFIPSSYMEGVFTENNPSFGDWNLVLIPSCDGGVFIGDKIVEYKDRLLYFTGQGMIKSMLSYLIQHHSLLNSPEVVLSGGSGGALATYIYSNYVQRLLPNSNVRSIADSGYFLDRTDKFHTTLQTFGSFLKNDDFANFFPECSYQYDDANEFYKCIIPEYSWEFIKPDTFIVGSLYDLFQYHAVYDFKCASKNIDTCDEETILFMDYLRDIQYDQVSRIMEARPTWGAWLISCSFHSIIHSDRVYSLNYTIPDESEWTGQKTIESWLARESDQKTQRLDKVDWPNNTGCAVHD